MREIKFRAWDNVLDKMVLWDTICETCGIDNLIGDKNYKLMQFTGLYDKNGKEIYEGDIIKKITGCSIMNGIETPLFYIGEIHSFNPITGYKCGKLELWANSSIIYDCEIIGNKHENKELLNQGN